MVPTLPNIVASFLQKCATLIITEFLRRAMLTVSFKLFFLMRYAVAAAADLLDPDSSYTSTRSLFFQQLSITLYTNYDMHKSARCVACTHLEIRKSLRGPVPPLGHL